MKSAALLICSIVFVSIVSMELYVFDPVGMGTSTPSFSANQNAYGEAPSLSEIVRIKLSNAISLMDRGETINEGTTSTPIALLLMTGLFGFAFWGRISSRKKRAMHHPL